MGRNKPKTLWCINSERLDSTGERSESRRRVNYFRTVSQSEQKEGTQLVPD